MFLPKINIFISFLLLVSGCGISYNESKKINSIQNIIVETPNTKFNLILKKDLKRTFINKPSKNATFILKTNISFSSSSSLSVSGLNVLKSTKGTVAYSLIDLKSGKVIKSGSIVTFPALSASSSSLYSNNASLEHIKERLCLSSSKKLYMHIKLIMQKLN
jgi:hypothetical protein